jgi:hypothetical protein
MGTMAFNLSLFVSAIISLLCSLYILHRLYPVNFHRIPTTQSCGSLIAIGVINLILGPLSGLICGSLFPFGEMYSPIAGLFAGIWGGCIGTILSIFSWGVYSKQYRNE